MKELTALLCCLLWIWNTQAQNLTDSPWHIQAKQIDPNRYFGITVANGMIGIVSSPNPLKVSEVVLISAYFVNFFRVHWRKSVFQMDGVMKASNR